MSQDFDELTRQLDALLTEEEPETPEDLDFLEYAPPGTRDEDLTIYPNKNGPRAVRNFANGYGAAPAAETPEETVTRMGADVRREVLTEQKRRKQEYRDYGEDRPKKPTRAQRKAAPSRKKRPGCCGCGCTTVLMLLAALVAAVFLLMNTLFAPPKTEAGLGSRKRDTATVLLCGTDKDGTRTDTMMLIYLSGSEREVSLLSLPRDTLTRTVAGNRAKLNSAYGRNGCGTEGMENLLLYVEDLIGYQPDGYILVDMTLVPKIVDEMGGLDLNVPQDIRVKDNGEETFVPAGEHHLNGEEVLATLRFRSGYYNADLGRVEVQRMVIKAAMDQWITPENIAKLPEMLEMVQNESITNMEANNFLWVGQTILLNLGNFKSETLPGYPDMIGGASYYILKPGAVAELVNESYNPYTTEITRDHLNIAED